MPSLHWGPIAKRSNSCTLRIREVNPMEIFAVTNCRRRRREVQVARLQGLALLRSLTKYRWRKSVAQFEFEMKISFRLPFAIYFVHCSDWLIEMFAANWLMICSEACYMCHTLRISEDFILNWYSHNALAGDKEREALWVAGFVNPKWLSTLTGHVRLWSVRQLAANFGRQGARQGQQKAQRVCR